MRNLLLATAALPFAVLATPVLPASADTVVRRETTIITREAPPAVAYRAPEAHYYTTPGRYRYAPRSGIYVSGYYYGAPAYGYDTPGYTNASDSECGWLYRRAVNTGSPYWWNRYNDCAD